MISTDNIQVAPQDPPPSAPPPSRDRMDDLLDRTLPQDPVPAPAPSLPRDRLDDLLDRQQQQSDLLRVASFNAAVKSNPDAAAEAQRLGRQLGLPSDVAERNLEQVRAISALRAYEDRNLAAFSPILDRQLRDPEFARIAHDDLDQLSTWEGMVRGFGIGKLETEQGMLGERLRGGIATQADIDRLAVLRTQLQSTPRPRGFLAGSAKVVGQQAVTVPKTLQVGLASGFGAAGVAMVAGQAGPQVLTPEEVLTVPSAFVSGFWLGATGAMAVQAFQMEAGDAYLDMLDRGYDKSTASNAAVGVGLANAALEMVGMKLLAKGAGLTGQALREALGTEVRKGVAEALVRPTLGQAGLRFAKGYGTGLGGEVATETLQEGVNVIAEEIARRLSTDPAALESAVTRGEIVQRLTETAAETAQGMALLALPGPSMHLLRDQRRAAAAEQQQQSFRAMAVGATESKVRQRSPADFERFAKDAVAGTGAENLFVDAQAFGQLLRQLDLTAGEKGTASAADELRATLPEVMQQVDEAMRTGGDVVIATEKFAAHIAGTPMADMLLPHLRTSADAMSFAEAEQFRREEPKLFADAEKEMRETDVQEQAFRASAAKVEERFREQLHAVQPHLQSEGARGVVSKRSLNDAAKLYRTMAEVQATAAGVTPEEIAAKFPLKVLMARGPQEGTLRQGATDNRTDTPEFKAWFGDSKVVDEKGAPLVVYHGTSRSFDQPDPEHPSLDGGLHLGSSDVAGNFAATTEGGRVYPVYLRVEKPLRLVDLGEFSFETVADQMLKAKKATKDHVSAARSLTREGENIALRKLVELAGYDGVVYLNRRESSVPFTVVRQRAESAGIKNISTISDAEYADLVPEASDSWMALLPEQIKSVNNRGTFDPADPNILRAGDRGNYDLQSFSILLHTRANFSTVVHELAHHHLNILGKIAADEELARTAPLHKRSVEQMQAFLKWRGIADLATWNAMSLEEQRPHHEAFAYSFEQWLHDGKAPSDGLRKLFARVARWMQKVYEVIRTELNAAYRKETGQDLPILTAEVRQMFDLMLSVDQDVRERAAATGALASFRSMKESGMSPEEWVAHQAQVDDAEESAVAEHQQDRLRDLQWFQGAESKLLAEKQRAHSATRKRLRADVEAELRTQAVYRARRWLTHGEFVDVDGSTTDAEGVHKLQTAAAKDLAPPGAELKTGRYGIVAKDGLHPDQAAKLFGFPSGRDLLAELVSAPELERAIDARTDERMLAEHGDLVDPQKRQEAVDLALHSDFTARLIATDFRHLQKALPPVRQLVAWAKKEAERLIGGRPLYQARRQDYVAAERRSAQRFQTAMAKGDIPAAAEARRAQLLQHMLVREAVAAQEDLDILRETLAGFLGSDERLGKTRDFDLVVLGRAIAARFGMRPSFTSSQEVAQLAAAKQVLQDGWPSLLERVVDYLPQPGTQASPLDHLTVAEMRDLQEVAEGLWEIAGDAKTVELQGQKADKAARVRALVQTAGERSRWAPGSQPPEGRASTTGLQRGLLGFWQIKAGITRLEHWARYMDGRTEGPFTNTFIVPVRKALATYWKARDAMLEAIHPRLRELRQKAGARWDADLVVPQEFLVEGSLTLRGKKELVGMLQQIGTESNLEKLLVPYGFALPPEQTNGYLDTSRWDRFLASMWHGDNPWITKEDLDYVQFIWGLYRDKLPADQAAYRKLYGVEFETIEHRKVHTPWGVIDGGYAPAYSDQFLTRMERAKKSDLVEDEQRAFVYSVGTGKGHTIQRNPFYRQRLALDLSRQANALDMQLRFAHLQPTLSEIMRIVRDKEFERAVGAVDRQAINQIITPVLESAALQTASRPGKWAGLDQVANLLRHVASLKALGFNFFNGLVQATGFSNARSEVGGRYLRAATFYTLRRPTEAVEQAMSRSEFMRERLDQRTRKMREEIARLGKGNEITRTWKAMQQAMARWAFLPQRYVQGAVDVSTWHGAYQQAIAESTADGSYDEQQAHERAVQHADSVVRRTQGSDNPEDLANYEADTPVMRLFTQFGSYSNVVLNQIMGAGEGVSPRLRTALWVLAMPALLEMAMRWSTQGAPDDDDGDGMLDEIALGYLGALGRNAAGMVPFVGPLALSLAKSEGTRVMETPAGTAARQLFTGLWSIDDAATGDVTPGQTRALGVLLTAVTGLPLHVVTRAVAFQQEVDAGKVRPQGAYDVVFGLLTGQATEGAKR